MAGEEQSLLGRLGQSFSAMKVGLNIDERPIQGLVRQFEALNKELDRVEKHMDAISKASQDLQNAMGAATGGGNTMASGTRVVGRGGNSSPKMEGALSRAKTILGGGPPGMPTEAGLQGLPTPRGAAISAGLQVAGAAVQQGIATIDNRINSGRDYALTADRMSVLYQQMTGMSQQAVQDRYRYPLTNYRLGAGGIEQLLALQSRTGINATQQAGSVEAFRTYSGYSLSTGDISRMMESLSSAPVANRMFTMMGGGLITAGGGQQDLQKVLQNIVTSAGLTDERLVKSGMAPGSMTRARLTQMGVPQELQDLALQYAQQNIQYQRKGGRGMYDASNKESRKLMGIEESFATQTEETARQRTLRDEKFYDRQADNYADLEKATQKLVRTMSAVEDAFSGLIGARASTKGKLGSIIGGTALGMIGTAIGGPAVGALAMTAGQFLGGLIGDPSVTEGGYKTANVASTTPRGDGASSSASDNSIMVPTSSGKRSIAQVKNWATFKGMNPKMQERVLNLMRAAGGRVGFTEGSRSYETQKSVFLQRYHRISPERAAEINKTNPKSLREWDGSYWEKNNPNDFDAAAPGRSMHGIGLAADLYGDIDWVVRNSGRFNLRNFKNVNNEGHHVQPAELPAGMTDYENAGAPWGMGSGAASDTRKAPALPVLPDSPTEGIAATLVESTAASSVSGAFGDDSKSHDADGNVLVYKDIATRVAQSVTPVKGVGGGAKNKVMSEEGVRSLLKANGFSGASLDKMVSIAKKLSGLDPSKKNISSGVDTYGLFQLAGEGTNWEYYRSKGLSNPDQLLDAGTNVNMAKATVDKLGMSELRGDPSVPERFGPSGGSSVYHAGNTFNINPNITLVSSGNTGVDMRKIAREVARMIEDEIRTTQLRSN